MRDHLIRIATVGWSIMKRGEMVKVLRRKSKGVRNRAARREEGEGIAIFLTFWAVPVQRSSSSKSRRRGWWKCQLSPPSA